MLDGALTAAQWVKERSASFRTRVVDWAVRLIAAGYQHAVAYPAMMAGYAVRLGDHSSGQIGIPHACR